MDSGVTFGVELRRLRLAAGLSLDGLRHLTFYSKGHLSKIETGLAVPPIRQAWVIDSAVQAGGRLVALLPDPPRSVARATAGGHPDPWSGLPHDSAHFQGRTALLGEAISLLCGRSEDVSLPVVCALSGMAGVGKTAFSVRVAHTVAGRFPDGCLFLDLHGYTGIVPPLSPAEALDRLLRRLGLPDEQIPAQLDERAACFRQLLIGKDTLLILDNALSSEQVRPLLPATAEGRVLINSRRRLVSLDDAHHLALDVLTQEEAAAVFSSVARVSSSGQQRLVGELVDACGRLPLALRIVAARCRDSPPLLIAELAARLIDERLRLDEIEDGERNVTAAFAVSYHELPSATQRVFALLGLHPGPDWTAHAAAALAGLDLSATTRHLEQLLNAHLLQRYSDSRYRFHDLVGPYAAHQAQLAISDPDRIDACRRLLTWARETLTMADKLITPHRHRLALDAVHQPRVGPVLRDYAEACAWVSAEQGNLADLCRRAPGWQAPSFSWQLAYDLRGYYFLSKRWDDWIATHETALGAAIESSDLTAEALTRNNLGIAFLEKGSLGIAEDQFLKALNLFEQLRDEHGISDARANHAAVLYSRGEYRQALRMNESAYESYRRSGRDRNAAITLRSIALVKIELGQFGAAVRDLESARQSFAELRLTLDELMAMNGLGEAYQRSGDLVEAEHWSRQALDRGESCGSSYEQARAYRNLGEIAVAQGDAPQAAVLWRQALSIYAVLRAPEADAVRDRIILLVGRIPDRVP
jgi:tetratricopeptide (TPR) repeat protein